VDDDFSFSTIIGMFLFDACFYFLVAWYLEGVWPGNFGVPKVWYFPFSPEYWCPHAIHRGTSGGDDDELLNLNGANSDGAGHFEPVPAGLTAGIELRDLRKSFGKKVAVAGTNLDMSVRRWPSVPQWCGRGRGRGRGRPGGRGRGRGCGCGRGRGCGRPCGRGRGCGCGRAGECLVLRQCWKTAQLFFLLPTVPFGACIASHRIASHFFASCLQKLEVVGGSS
jgi:hypothetical protein